MRELSIYDFVEHANTNLNALAKVLGISRQRLEYWAKSDGCSLEFDKDNQCTRSSCCVKKSCGANKKAPTVMSNHYSRGQWRKGTPWSNQQGSSAKRITATLPRKGF
jgi:hypothetical protein